MARNQSRRKSPVAERLAGNSSLTWERGDKYHIRSGPYFVCKAWTADGWRYVASMNKQILGVFASAELAKASVDRWHAAAGRGK